MAKAQSEDADVKVFPTAITNLQFERTPLHNSPLTLLCDVPTGQPRPIVPKTFQCQVFEAIHNLAHPDCKSSVKLDLEKFVWHGLKKQTAQHDDLKPSPGQTILLQSAPKLSYNTGLLVWESLQIYCQIEDLSLPFLWKAIANQPGVTLHRTTSYHPQSNGLIERLHRTLKAALKARLKGPNWVDELPWVLLGLRRAPQPDLGSSSAEQVYGHPLPVPGQFIDPTFRSHRNVNDPMDMTIRRFSPVPTSNNRWHPQSAASMPQSIQNAKFVFIRRDAHRGPL
ncbi:Pol polyprotein [Elysia marginata]|uniref:Pol polyprotein n=1 Tax=Elysia marginata TaxID=1093978 RepID=A0AAV4GBJ0_9GAST|nr:Pol polyprotein [Elysia marginata]